ncbi:hypothetical protein ACHAW6_010507 [Cyclotella cf. meneghiniana]
MNTISEVVYAQCDPDGNQYIMLDAITDYQKNPDIVVSCNKQVKIVNGKKVILHFTQGWELCCEWKDGSTSWQKLLDIKESRPLQVAEFALSMGIAEEPAFNWWMTWVLKKRDWIISQAYAINKATSTTFWHYVIGLEIKNVWVVFDVLVDGVMSPSDHLYMRCHMIFDAKMENFHHKVWLVAGIHMTKPPAALTYASIMFQKAILVCALYELKSSGAAFKVHLVGCLHEMGYRLCPADPDLWLKEQPDRNGNHYYAHIFCYVEDLLVVHHNPRFIIDKIDRFILLMPDSTGPS